MKLKEFHRLVRHETIWVVDFEERRWVTEGHWLVPLEDSLAWRLLHAFNLDGEEGEYEVRRHVRRTGDVPEKCTRALPALLHPTKDAEVLTLRTLQNRPLLVQSNQWGPGPLCAVYDRADGEVVTFSRKFLRVVAGETWAEAKPEQFGDAMSTTCFDESLLMPVRLV